MLVGIQAGNLDDTGMMVEMGSPHLQCVAYNHHIDSKYIKNYVRQGSYKYNGLYIDLNIIHYKPLVVEL